MLEKVENGWFTHSRESNKNVKRTDGGIHYFTDVNTYACWYSWQYPRLFLKKNIFCT